MLMLNLSCSKVSYLKTALKTIAKTPTYPIQSSNLYLKSNKYQQDFLYYVDALIDTHPGIHSQFPREGFEKEKRKIFNHLKNCTNDGEFEVILQSFTAYIKDSHTNILFINITNSKKYYPVWFNWFGDSLYVIDTSNDLPNEIIGSIVTYINNIPINKVRKMVTKYISCENHICENVKMTSLLRNPIFLEKINLVSSDQKLIIKNSNNQSFSIFPQKSPKGTNQIKYHPITKKQNEPFSYQIFNDRSVAYFQFNQMIDKATVKHGIKMINFIFRPYARFGLAIVGKKFGVSENFSDFLPKMFTDLEKNNVKNIIIDLRYNGGGNSLLANQLFYCLGVPKDIKDYSGGIKISELYKMTNRDDFNERNKKYKKKYNTVLKNKLYDEEIFEDKENKNIYADIENSKSRFYIPKLKNKFKGKVYLLIGPNTFSSASWLATLASDNNLFTIVGEPISQKPTSFGDFLILKLPNTKILCGISHKIFYRPDTSKNAECCLFPDIEIKVTYEDYKNGKDLAFDWILEDISKIRKERG